MGRRHHRIRVECGRGATRIAGDELSGPLPSNQDQAAPRRMGSASRDDLDPSRAVGRGSRVLCPGLRGVLRIVSTSGQSGHASAGTHGDPHSRRRHDRIRCEQVGEPDHGGVLSLCDRGDAGRRVDRRLPGAACAGGVRHRVLAAGGGEASAHARAASVRRSSRAGRGGGLRNRAGVCHFDRRGRCLGGLPGP